MQDEDHENLEMEATSYLEGLGFLVTKQPYHEFMPQEIRNLLQGRFSLTTLYIRGRADRLAIHPNHGIEFEWEAKTVPSNAPERNINFSIEVWPLIHHIQRATLGVRCLYVCQHCRLDYSFGFWIDNIPPIHRIIFPSRIEYAPIQEFMEGEIKKTLSWYGEIENPPPSQKPGVSNDPFILIRKRDAMQQPDWKDMIRFELDNSGIIK